MINKIIGGMISGFIGISLYPVIDEQIQTAIQSNPSSFSPLSLAMMNYVPVFFVIAVSLTTITMILSAFMDFGMEAVEEDIKEEEYNPNKKQTYEEYVAERLKVERMMKYGWIGRWI